MNSLNLCLNIFKCLCILATAFMVGYWLFKFEKNSDVTLIEYKSIDEMPDFIYPELSICFLNPFVVSESLNVTNNYKFYTRYSEYLKGKIESKEYEALKYENASVNLANYLKELNIGWKPKKNPRNPKKQITKYRDLKNCPYATFKNNYNGFARGYDFNKCFGVEMNKDIGTDVTHFQIVFDGSLSEIIRQVGATIVLFNYPNQIVRPRGGAISIWQKENGTKAIMFPMSSVDVLIRRNKRNARCNDQWSSYDSQVLRKHIEKFGCRPPYISQHLEFPMCKSKEEIQRAYFDGWSLANNYSFVPCQEMPTMDFKSFVVKRGEHFKRYTITVYFPTKGKTITQLQEVDVHTLIGNIGGYIGLFLGYAIIQAPDYVLSFFRYLKKKQCGNSLRANMASNANISIKDDAIKVAPTQIFDTDRVIMVRNSKERPVNDRLDDLESAVDNILKEIRKIGLIINR